MRFKALLAGAVLCLAGAPASAATYLGTVKEGETPLEFAIPDGRSLRATIIFSEPVDVTLFRYYWLFEGVFDRRTGVSTYRTETRDDPYPEIRTSRVQVRWNGFQRSYFKNNVVYRIAFGNTIALNVKANEALSYTATINASGVPEPSTWTLMILGIGLAGVALRKRRTNTMLV